MLVMQRRHAFPFSFNKYAPSLYKVPGIAASPGNRAVDKPNRNICPHRVYILLGEGSPDKISRMYSKLEVVYILFVLPMVCLLPLECGMRAKSLNLEGSMNRTAPTSMP